MKLPLFVNVPLLILRSPAIHVAVPSFCNTRCRLWAVLFMTSVPVLPMIVRPLPLIVPLVQVNVPVTVTSPAPESVPVRVKPLKLCTSPKLTVPERFTPPL